MRLFKLEPEALLSPPRRNAFAFMSLAVIILAIYSNSFEASWHFDDQSNILERDAMHLTKLNWSQIKKTFFNEDGNIYRPVPCLSFALNYYFGKTRVFGYHVVNTAVHVITSFFLFLFVFHTLRLPSLRERYVQDAYFIALLAAVLWAINPVQTQAVTYIVQRMASMAAMFTIMSMFFYLKGRISKDRRKAVLHFSACAVFGLMAFGSKENAAMLPFSLLLFDLFLIQGFSRKNILRSFYIFLLLIIVPLILMMVLRGPEVLHRILISDYEIRRPFTMTERLLTEPRIVLFYLSLLFYPMPFRLSIVHDIAISQGLLQPISTLLAILGIFAIVGMCLLGARRFPLVCYCILFFFMNHIIEGSIFALELIFEHRNYLPSMLLFVPVAILLVKGIRYFSYKLLMQCFLAGFAVLYVVGVGHSTFARNFVWRDDGTLWSDATEKASGLVRPHLNLGKYFYDQRMMDQALTEYIKADNSEILSRKVDRYINYYNIGLIYHKKAEYQRALVYYKKCLHGISNHGDTYNNMGLIFREQGKLEQATRAMKKAIFHDPNHLAAHKNLALIYLKQDQYKKAAFWLEKAHRINPYEVAVLGALGYTYRLIGSYGKAYLYLQRAAGIEPHDPKVHLYLAELYFKMGMKARVGGQLIRFIKLANDADIRGYVQGTAGNEHQVAFIQPFKGHVLDRLAEIYEGKADLIRKGIDHIQEKRGEADSDTEMRTDGKEKETAAPGGLFPDLAGPPL